MRTGEECGYCSTLLDVHCTLHGPQFCAIKDEYYTSPHMGIDDVYDRLYAVATPEQIHEASRMVKAREAQGLPPSQPSPVTVDNRGAQAAAARWLDHWQHGKP